MFAYEGFTWIQEYHLFLRQGVCLRLSNILLKHWTVIPVLNILVSVHIHFLGRSMCALLWGSGAWLPFLISTEWLIEYHRSRPGLEILQQRIDDFIIAHEAQEEQVIFLKVLYADSLQHMHTRIWDNNLLHSIHTYLRCNPDRDAHLD